jgi:hypothetical protein
MSKLRTFASGRLLVILVLLGSGCNRQDTERLAKVGKRIMARADELTGEVRAALGSGLQGVRAGGEEIGLAARVSARLRWDQTLADVKIDVQAAGTVVELKGTVRDLTQRRRAVELAESTVGVEKVTDLLQTPDVRP